MTLRQAMISWLQDAGWRARGDYIHFHYRTSEIAEMVEKYYEGGMPQFLADSPDVGGGICADCFEVAYGVEPDAERYECNACGASAVYGAEMYLLMTVA